jgi:hypothetical protein
MNQFEKHLPPLASTICYARGTEQSLMASISAAHTPGNRAYQSGLRAEIPNVTAGSHRLKRAIDATRDRAIG